MQASGDHQMQDQPQVTVKADRDPFAQPAQLDDLSTLDGSDRRGERAQQKRAGQSHLLEPLADDATGERF